LLELKQKPQINSKGGVMNILLVYPKYPETFWSFKHALKFVAKKAAFPPLGLLTIASLLPKEWTKRLVDENVEKITDKHLAWADMVFVSAMIVQKESVSALISRCSALGKTIVAGGPLFNSQPDLFPQVDHLILGEAEDTLPLFLEDLARGSPKRLYSFIGRPDLSKTPLPMWSLVRFKHYATMLVQYSRGCPFDCEFCDITVLNGRIPRVKTPEQMMAEFQALYDLGWRGTVFVVDDNFIGNKRAVKEMLPHLIRWQKKHGYPFKFLTEASVNLAQDDELIALMTQANFSDVFLGLETPCVESLKEAGKTQNTVVDLSSAVVKLQQNGLHVMGGFMVGFDHDNPKTIFSDLFRFIQEAGVPVAMIGTVMALPGTKLWRRLKDEGRLLSDSSGNNTIGETNFDPVMGMNALTDGFRELLRSLYTYKNYFARVERFVLNYRPRPVRSRVSFNDIAALVKSMCYISICSRARFRYLKVIVWTLVKNKAAFPLVVKDAIYWPHFRKISLSTAKER
jgi:radical SAM superfamily enzyme YgiQ (UPF0313 family)